MNMVATLIGSLERPDIFGTVPRHLGARHERYGVAAEHYPAVGEALIETLAETLSERFTSDVRDAWIALYTEVAQAMTAERR